jgi:hypothetical protein
MWEWFLEHGFRVINFGEGCLWLLIGFCFVISLFFPGLRGRKTIAAVTFILFGFSDWVEMNSVNWWEPWWLLAWKGVCGIILFLLLLDHLLRQQRKRRQTS